MVTQQILVLYFCVRIAVAQQINKYNLYGNISFRMLDTVGGLIGILVLVQFMQDGDDIPLWKRD